MGIKNNEQELFYYKILFISNSTNVSSSAVENSLEVKVAE
ncbi:hypothetical protein NMS_2139 [Nonlabens marinus S1-08]|uniref:Uncharacterized protein n=1 Tax=Nonlabens marinus S1-08 TaxID=1454201 RepID=W8VWA3_9FLAO|nr:hypothetical protein NMS_2139 [Nonlabens marinus S1-08]